MVFILPICPSTATVTQERWNLRQETFIKIIFVRHHITMMITYYYFQLEYSGVIIWEFSINVMCLWLIHGVSVILYTLYITTMLVLFGFLWVEYCTLTWIITVTLHCFMKAITCLYIYTTTKGESTKVILL